MDINAAFSGRTQATDEVRLVIGETLMTAAEFDAETIGKMIEKGVKEL